MNNKGKMIERVYAADLTQRATLVIFYLINRADKENTCFPSIKTIAKECNISSRTVQRALNDLEEAGFLIRESRFHTQGGQRSNLYRLLISEDDKDKDRMKNNDTVEEIKKENTESNQFDGEIESKTDDADLKANKEFIQNIELVRVDFASYASIRESEDYLSGPLCHDGLP